MRIELHIGLEQCGAARLQTIMATKRAQMTDKGVRFAESVGNKNHTRLWMAVTDPAHVDPLRFNRGYITAEKQTALRQAVQSALIQEVETHKPDVLILSAAQLCWLARQDELERLRDLLSPLSKDVRITAHVDEQARVLTRMYASQVLEGRAIGLDQERALLGHDQWWRAALKAAPKIDPQSGQFLETQATPFWLDYTSLVAHWDAVFGANATHLRGFDPDVFNAQTAPDEICAAFGIEGKIGKAAKRKTGVQPSAAWLARGRQLNALLLHVLVNKQRILPRPLWRNLMSEIAIDGDALDPGSLSQVSQYFAQDNAGLTKQFPALSDTVLAPSPKVADWVEADPGNGYRASQYLLSFMGRIDKATQQEKSGKAADLAAMNGASPAKDNAQLLSDDARAIMPPLAVQNFMKLRNSPFAPHNSLGDIDEATETKPYTLTPASNLAQGRSGNVIVGCMKNEAPYILEWVAYHRAIGVDNFLIYTNGCEDGTSEMLDRLQEMGVLQHRLNDDWKGKSPQQHALNCSLNEPVIKNADWIIHIDVDEFMNIRCGNGTLTDLFDHIPDATNIAMTWRLFGHNGIVDLDDRFVIDQFDTCAPKFCPKPHTVWGFKTMFQNIGAYDKISCHRPNKLRPEMESKVSWANGSGQDMTKEAAHNGWRSSKKSIGYDLIQLNHYALRSAESFLVKRQRGRALHVDRSIGLNYWIRMDWNDHKDLTIKRNLPRLQIEYDQLMQDPQIKDLHERGLAWHRAKADELHTMPEFQDLYEKALKVKLNETERVAYALALDMES